MEWWAGVIGGIEIARKWDVRGLESVFEKRDGYVSIYWGEKYVTLQKQESIMFC